MTKPAEPSTPSGSSATTTKATDHELQKHDIFTRYGQMISDKPKAAVVRKIIAVNPDWQTTAR
jgi:hypothetical protein